MPWAGEKRVFSAGKDRRSDWRGKFRIMLRQIPEIARRAGERRPERERAGATFGGEKAVAGRAPNSPEKKVRQITQKFTRNRRSCVIT